MASRTEYRGDSKSYRLGIVTPVWNAIAMTEQFVRQLRRDRAEFATAIIFDNGSEPENLAHLYAITENVAHVRSTPDLNIHEMWNQGMEFCENAKCDVVAVLNNDIVWQPRALTRSATGLLERNGDLLLWDRVKPRMGSGGNIKPVFPNVRRGGPPGWGMFIRAGRGWRFDERYNFYGGDIDFNLTVAQAGGSIYRWFNPPAMHLEHKSADTSDRYRELIRKARTEDRDLWNQKWGLDPKWDREEPV